MPFKQVLDKKGKMVDRKELGRGIAEAYGITYKMADEILISIFNTIEDVVLNEGDSVRIHRFGTFKPKRINRSGVAPDGKPYKVDKTVLGFKASKKS